MVWSKLLNIQGISAFTCGLWSTVWCKKDGAVCVLLLPAKYMGHGSCMVGRESPFKWVIGSWVTVNDPLPVQRGGRNLTAGRCGIKQSSRQRFQTLPLIVGSGNKSATKLSLKIPPHLERVATLPCQISDARLTDSDQRPDFLLRPALRFVHA